LWPVWVTAVPVAARYELHEGAGQMEYRPRRASESLSRSRQPLRSVALGCAMAVIGAIVLVLAAPLTASAAPGSGVWSDNVQPRTTADPDTSSVELGTIFVSAVDGWVTGIRYYKSPANKGPHVGKLWSSSGELLTSVAFSAESSTGWQTADLASPLRISKGKSYTVSYRAPSGRYADDEWVFTNGRTIKNGPLTAVRGVYTYGSGRPALVWHDSNYYVDVKFVDIQTGVGSALPPATAAPQSTPTPTPAPKPTATAGTSLTATPSPTAKPTAVATTVSPSASSSDRFSSSPAPTAWPNEANTGVAGCPPLTRRDSDLRITTSGTTVQNVELHGQLTFANGVKNVTVRCVKVISGTWFPIDTERSNYTSANDVLLERVEVTCNGSSTSNAGMLLFGVTVRKGRVYGCTDAFKWSSEVVIEDSLCHNLQAGGYDPHYDCAQTGGADNVIIRRNTFIGRDTSDIAIWPDLDSINNVLVEDNLLIGSPGYKIYIGKNSKPYPVTNVVVRNNRFGSDGHGPCSIENTNPLWEGNVWQASGLPLPRSLC
jgi:hypothetical protein